MTIDEKYLRSNLTQKTSSREGLEMVVGILISRDQADLVPALRSRWSSLVWYSPIALNQLLYDIGALTFAEYQSRRSTASQKDSQEELLTWFLGVTSSNVPDEPAGPTGTTPATWTATEFTDGTFLVNLLYDYDTGYYTTDYDKTDYNNVATGTAWYVDKALGNDTTGTGSEGAPFATIAKAMTSKSDGDVVYVAPGRYPEAILNTTGSFALINSDPESGRVIVSPDLLSSADVSAWGSLTSGSQTVTLNSGDVGWFVDLTRDDATMGYPQVSRVGDAAFITASQAEGRPAITQDTPAVLGSGDARDMSGEEDSTIILINDSNSLAFRPGSAAEVYLEGITLLGRGNLINASRLVADNCELLGSMYNEVLLSGASCRSHLHECTVVGIGVSDIVDYDGTAVGSEYNCKMDQAGLGSADNTSTAHNASYALRVGEGSRYRSGSRTVHDVGTGLTGNFDITTGGDTHSGRIGLGVGSGADSRVAYLGGKISLVGNLLIGVGELSTNFSSTVYLVDPEFTVEEEATIPYRGSLAGVIWENLDTPTDFSTLFRFDPSTAGLSDGQSLDGETIGGQTWTASGTVVYEASTGAALMSSASWLVGDASLGLLAGESVLVGILYRWDVAGSSSAECLLGEDSGNSNYAGRAANPVARHSTDGIYYVDGVVSVLGSSSEVSNSFDDNQLHYLVVSLADLTSSWGEPVVGAASSIGGNAFEGAILRVDIAENNVFNLASMIEVYTDLTS